MSKPRTFNINEPFVARGGLMWNGVHFEEGAPFDWRGLGLTQLQAWDLWRSFMIDNASFAAPEPPPANPAAPVPNPAPPAATTPPAKSTRAERRAARS